MRSTDYLIIASDISTIVLAHERGVGLSVDAGMARYPDDQGDGWRRTALINLVDPRTDSALKIFVYTV